MASAGAGGDAGGGGGGAGEGGGGIMAASTPTHHVVHTSEDIASVSASVPLVAASDERPTNHLVTPLLTDMYQITMAYAYWKAGRHRAPAVFDTFFRKNPFRGEFTVFAGLEEVLRLIQTFKITKEEIDYIRGHPSFADAEDGFFTEYLPNLDCSEMQVYAVREGSVSFPRVPVIRIEGPLGICQLLETTILNLVNFPSLMTTNAARFRKAAGRTARLLEFGLRRAQGPDGGMSATRYSYMGGFDGTSNVLGGQMFGVDVSGTHAHSFVSSYSGIGELADHSLKKTDGTGDIDLLARAQHYASELEFTTCNEGELAAFIAYAVAFPKKFLALVDTYETLKSGIPNFICVALSLIEAGYKPLGIRLDSGDLSYLSKAARRMFHAVDAKYPWAKLARSTIVASNDINEPVLISLNDQGHEIDAFGIGTNLVTCQAQPALGMVFKLVEINSKPRIKLSQEVAKVTIPGRKQAYRLYGKEGVPLADLLIRESGDPVPIPGESYLCRHPADDKKQVRVKPTTVVPLLHRVWIGKNFSRFWGATDPASAAAAAEAVKAAGVDPSVNVRSAFPSLAELREFTHMQLESMREDHMRPLNPTPYKVSVSSDFYHFIKDLWESEAPVPQLE